MSNYPPDVSATDPAAPWNKQRSQHDINEEIDSLHELQKWADKLALELATFDDTAELFAPVLLAQYARSGPGDMLDAMLDIIRVRLAELKQL